MLNQLQFYEVANPQNRHIIAQVDGLLNEIEIANWKDQVLAANQLPEGYGSFIVPENNPWYIKVEPEPSLLAIPNIADTGNNGVTGEVELLPYEIAGAIQLRIDDARRIAEIEQQQRLAEYMAAFPG